MQQHLFTQDFNFVAFASYVIEALVSLRTNMNENHEAILSRINHIIYVHDNDFIDLIVSIGKYVMLLILNTVMTNMAGKRVHQEDMGEDRLVFK